MSRRSRSNDVLGLALTVAGVLGAAGCQWTEATEAPNTQDTGCAKDTDCKGDRICEAGVCVAPRPPEPAVSATSRPPAPATGKWARGGPGHARELVSQLRLGDPVEVLEQGAEWHRLRGPDGYVAYGKANNVTLMDTWHPTHMVVAPFVRIELPEEREMVLSAGTRLVQAGPGRYRLPDGVELAIPEGLAPLGKRGDVASVLAFAKCFLGLPYLWGGTSCWGLDCSGLVQLAYAVHGVQLPRDADQQQAATEPVAQVAELQAGDLVFFPGHVGISLGGGRYIHASAKVGCVTVNAFDPADPLFDPDLLSSFTGGGRSPLAAYAAR